MKERLSKIGKEEDIRISAENVKTTIRKMTNWKVPGPDCVQRYLFKRFSTLHPSLTEHPQICMVVGDVPAWITNGKTTLMQTDTEKGNTANSYCSITCLPLMWKLLTGVLVEKVNAHLVRMCYRMSRRNAGKTHKE